MSFKWNNIHIHTNKHKFKNENHIVSYLPNTKIASLISERMNIPWFPRRDYYIVGET